MIKNKLITSGLITVLTLANMNLTVFASSVPVTITAAATPIDVTMSESIDLNLRAGEISTEEIDINIKNNSNVGVIQVTQIELNAQGDWVFVDNDSDFAKMAANSKNIYLSTSLADGETLDEDSILLTFDELTIVPKAEVDVPFKGYSSIRTTTLTDEAITEAVVTLGYITYEEPTVIVDKTKLFGIGDMGAFTWKDLTGLWKIGDTLGTSFYGTTILDDFNPEFKTEYNSKIASGKTTTKTWVRAMLGEFLMINGVPQEIVAPTTLDANGRLKSTKSKFAFYYKEETDTTFVKMSEWDGSYGEFWVLDENSGWLYWATPLNATDPSNASNQGSRTKPIIDGITYITTQSGSWQYDVYYDFGSVDVYNIANDSTWAETQYSAPEVYEYIVQAVMLDKVNFPNATFRNYVKQFDLNSDGILSLAERNAVTTMDLTGIKETTGIEHFTNLQ